jgi:aldehyde dehydrogenase (NAD+)
MAEAVHAAELPPGVFNMVLGTGPAVGEPLATLRGVDMVSFTGSTAVGRRLHALGAGSLKRARRRWPLCMSLMCAPSPSV